MKGKKSKEEKETAQRNVWLRAGVGGPRVVFLKEVSFRISEVTVA